MTVPLIIDLLGTESKHVNVDESVCLECYVVSEKHSRVTPADSPQRVAVIDHHHVGVSAVYFCDHEITVLLYPLGKRPVFRPIEEVIVIFGHEAA